MFTTKGKENTEFKPEYLMVIISVFSVVNFSMFLRRLRLLLGLKSRLRRTEHLSLKGTR